MHVLHVVLGDNAVRVLEAIVLRNLPMMTNDDKPGLDQEDLAVNRRHDYVAALPR